MFHAEPHISAMEYGPIVQEMMDRSGLNQTEIARKLRVTQPTVSRWLKGQKPDTDQHERIVSEARRLGIIPGNSLAMAGVLDEAPAPGPAQCRVVGYVGAGDAAHFYSINQGDIDEVPTPDGASTDTVAVRIVGPSLGPFFDQALAFYDNVQRPVTADLVGRLCIVGLEDGRVLIKKLRRGKGDLFTLISQTEDPIRDVAVEWAARVIDVRPR